MNDRVTDFSVLLIPDRGQDVSCLGRYGRDICPKTYAKYELGTFNPQLSVYI